jgi:hypothetical protein
VATKLSSTQAAELVPQNAQRRSFTFQNEDTTDSIWIKKERPSNTTVSSTDHDYKILPGASISLNFQSDGQEAIQERWTFIASANTPRICYVETEDFKR